MRYTVLSGNNRNFEIRNELGADLGSFKMNAWFPLNVEITTAYNDVFLIRPAGFWQTRMEITKNGIPYAELKPKFARGFVMAFESGRSLLFRNNGFWSIGKFQLKDEQDNEVATIRAWFSWKTFGQQYDLEIKEHMLDKELCASLPFLLVYAARLARIRQATVAAG